MTHFFAMRNTDEPKGKEYPLLMPWFSHERRAENKLLKGFEGILKSDVGEERRMRANFFTSLTSAIIGSKRQTR